MSTKFASSYTCVSANYLKETFLISKNITLTFYINWMQVDWRNT